MKIKEIFGTIIVISLVLAYIDVGCTPSKKHSWHTVSNSDAQNACLEEFANYQVQLETYGNENAKLINIIITSYDEDLPDHKEWYVSIPYRLNDGIRRIFSCDVYQANEKGQFHYTFNRNG